MRACLEVNLKNLTHNVQTLSHLEQRGNYFFCPIIKANAYGHGVQKVVPAIRKAGVQKVGVISLEEARSIRKIDHDIQIYIFGPYDETKAHLIESHFFIPVVGDWPHLKALAKLKAGGISFQLKFNIGLNRFGFDISEIPSLIKYIKQNPHLQLEGLASHLSEGEALATKDQKSPVIQQAHLFKKILTKFQQNGFHKNLHTHLLSSSSGLALWSHSKWDPVLGFRPGICLYGIKAPVVCFSDSAKEKLNSCDLKPVSCLKSFVIAVRTVSRGAFISYGQTWMAQKKSVIAIVSMGYADGLPYLLSNKGEVLFQGQRVPIIGRVCMDVFMIDITAVVHKESEVKVGEEVVIFGPQKKGFISIEEQAGKARSVPKELLTRLGDRVHRIYLT